MNRRASSDLDHMREALCLARRGYGATSPNPMVGALLVKGGQIIGRGWHHRAGDPHAEIEAIQDAQQRGRSAKGSTLYVTLEPCCTHGRTPPCTEAILGAGITRVVAGATDPNPRHCGRAFDLLERAGVTVLPGVLAEQCMRINRAFNHWIVEHTPFVTVKAAMTLDGKIATASGESKWITSERARAFGMRLRLGVDAVLAGVNTVLADDPSLTLRPGLPGKNLRRIILDARARTPLRAKVVSDPWASLTTIVVGKAASGNRVAALSERVHVMVAPVRDGKIDLRWLLRRLGREEVTSLLVEGGGEVNASFLLQGLAQAVAFFYAPKILGGLNSRRAVGGDGAVSLGDALELTNIHWRRLGPDWLMEACVAGRD